jgi:hypothetical protein
MEKIKRKIKILMLVTTLIITVMPIVVSADIELATLDYRETKIVSTSGNVTLAFINSTTGTNDVIVLWRIYGNDSNITVFCIESKEIEYDYTFVNDTKRYYYLNTWDSKTYIIYVNYSSIQVPKSQEQILNDTKNQYETIINSLNTEITDLKKSRDELNNTKIQLETDVETWKQTAEEYLSERDEALGINLPLHIKIDNLSAKINDTEMMIAELNYTIRKKDRVIESLEGTISKMMDPLCLGYSYKGSDYLPPVNFLFIFLTILFTGLFSVVTVSKLKGKKVKDYVKSHSTTDVEKARSHSLFRNWLSPEKSDKRIEVAEGQPQSFDMDPEVISAKLKDELDKTPIEKVMEIEWKLKTDNSDVKTWGYNGVEPIIAKKNGGIWEIFVDGVKQPDTYGTPLDLYNNIRKYQKEYQINDVHDKVIEQLDQKEVSENGHSVVA